MVHSDRTAYWYGLFSYPFLLSETFESLRVRVRTYFLLLRVLKFAGKKLPEFPAEEAEVLLFLERVSDAKRISQMVFQFFSYSLYEALLLLPLLLLFEADKITFIFSSILCLKNYRK